jgi:hypothetical protein
MEVKIIVMDYLLFIEFQLGHVRRMKRGKTNYLSTQIINCQTIKISRIEVPNGSNRTDAP